MNPREVLADLGPVQSAMLGDPRICVAVLDGPADLSHPCFAGANVRRLDTLVQDPAGQGPMSVHGTHVTSLIFGQPGSPVAGIAPRCQGLIAPVFQDFDERRLSQLDLARAVEQAVQEGAHVINISGGQPAPGGQAEGILERALRLCEDSNVLVVAAVGNDGCACVHVPAAVPSTIGVGALGKDGKPLQSSNWGESYKLNGILAPGENIVGAAPGGGKMSLTGSSFATPIVSAVAALLLSIQVQEGRRPDPRAVRRALLQSAVPCNPRDSPECSRYLVGTLNIPEAYASVRKGGRSAMESTNTTAGQPAQVEFTNPGADAGIAPRAAITAAALDDRSAGSPESVRHSDPTSNAPESAVPVISAVVPAKAASSSVVPAGDCGCGNNNKKSYVYSIGNVGFDFGTEADRDAFRQLMPDHNVAQEGQSPVTVPPNPYDVSQLVSYLDDHPYDSINLIWTLNLDLTPIYAIEAEQAYAEDVYSRLREALGYQALPPGDENYVSRVSIPGTLTSRTRRLFSGQVVPVVVAQPRGLYTWSETKLVDAIVQQVAAGVGAAEQDAIQLTVRMLLDKVYYEFRNTGYAPQDRALNYAGTNAFAFAEGIASRGLLSARVIPGGGNQIFTIDTITVSKSPYCRIDSDCWDIQVTFFNPENARNARAVYQFTIDVSKEMPVSLAPVHQFLVAPSVTLVSNG